MKYSEMMWKKYDEIMEMILTEEKEDPSFDMDLYMEENGDLYWFSNPGGNSWLDVPHIVVCTINHENWEYRAGTEEFEQYIEYEARDAWDSQLTDRIRSQEVDEK